MRACLHRSALRRSRAFARRRCDLSTTTALATFAGSLLLSIVSGAVLGERIEQLGARLGFTEAFLGILTALGADAPEISSAVTALHRGQHDLRLANSSAGYRRRSATSERVVRRSSC